MILEKQLDKLTGLMKENKTDVLVVGPSPDLEYLTGLRPLIDERFKALFILSDGRYFYISPELCYEETREVLGENADIFTWSDSLGFLEAFGKMNKYYDLDGKTIGVNDGIRAVDLIEMRNILNANFTNGCRIMERMRIIKTKEEMENLRRAAQIADMAASQIVNFIRPGIAEREIKKKIEQILFENGGQELAFETIVASGPNSSKPHYNDDGRIIEKKDVIIMDFGCRYNGYCSDISRTAFVGEPTDEQKKIYGIVVEANSRAEACAREGAAAEEVDLAARNVIRQAGYGQYFFNRTGHGIGVGVHEAPNIMEGNKQVLQNGMAFSVEPGIYIAGNFGMRVEDIVLIDNGRGEVLNNASKEMIIIR
ncbi:MAG: Xaa-Pro peptidase family protein [Tepidanaerobacteraceae bacterium]|jgi:Xaa-Pro dipeptidase|nr:Xaa-Pro peptidase family protein [Tepidanaerobacteraceae bacterium]